MAKKYNVNELFLAKIAEITSIEAKSKYEIQIKNEAFKYAVVTKDEFNFARGLAYKDILTNEKFYTVNRDSKLYEIVIDKIKPLSSYPYITNGKLTEITIYDIKKICKNMNARYSNTKVKVKDESITVNQIRYE